MTQINSRMVTLTKATLGAVLFLVFACGLTLVSQTAYAQWDYDYYDYSGIGDADYYDYSSSYDNNDYSWSYDYSDYGGIGDADYYNSYDTTSYGNTSWSYDYSDYSGIGDADYYTYTDTTDYGNTSWSYDYSDYTGIGDAGDGCCNDTTDYGATSWSYDYSDYTGIGDAGDGCCDGTVIDYPDQPQPDYPDYPDWPEPVYPIYDDVAFYEYTGGYSYTYTPSTYNYNYTPYTYTYTPPTQNYTYEPSCLLTVVPNTIDEDGRATLVWTTEHTTSVTINNGIGAVAQNGNRVVSPNDTTTYVLTARGPGGSVSCVRTLVVDEENDVDDTNLRCELTVRPGEVEEDDYVTLEWDTTDATDVDINHGVGDVSNDGTRRVRVDEDTTFVLTARNGSDTITCRDSVDVEEDTDEDTDEPRCTLRASDTDIEAGDRVTLRWNNDHTDRIVLRDNRNHEIADSDEDRGVDEDDDSIVVRPTRTTEYTLTAYNGSDRDTCRVEIDVDENERDVTVTGTRTRAPATTTISLTQVPYTGFDAGPFLTTVFYTLIVLWGAIVAYVLVVKKRRTEAVVATTGTQALAQKPQMAIITEPSYVPTAPREMHVAVAPMNLPTVQAEEVVFTEDTTAQDALEAIAQDARVLISSDALRFIVGQTTDGGEQIALLNRVIAAAKAQYPQEDGWVVLNKERMLTLLK